MIAVDNQLFSLVKHVAFHGLINHLAPWYTISSKRTMSQRVLSSMHCSTVQLAKAELAKVRCQSVHQTADLWSSNYNGSLSLNTHWWQPKSSVRAQPQHWQERACFPHGDKAVLLYAQIMDVEHTAVNISAVMRHSLRENLAKESYLIMDGGSNMYKAAKGAHLII